MINLIHLLTLTFLLNYNGVPCKTTYFEMLPPNADELSFMKRYGYLPEAPPDADAAYTPASIQEAVSKMQAFAGLPQTGVLDQETRQLFHRRRCGVTDIDSTGRNKRFIVVQGWNKRTVTYRVLNSSSSFEKEKVEEHMARAFSIWSRHASLKFRRVDTERGDIELSFVREEHGDGFPFDGPGHVVAHAFPPTHGEMHFDDDEIWGENTDGEEEDVTDFFAVAIHEIGHALGLAHSSDRDSVMYPYYHVPVRDLGRDDISGLQELYLINPPTDETPRVTENSLVSRSSLITISDDEDDDVPNLCYSNYDTIQVIDGRLFVFEEEWMWVMGYRRNIELGFPRLFREVFVGLPDYVTSVRAIYENREGNIVILYSRTYYVFDKAFRYLRKGSLSDYGVPADIPELTTVFLSNYNNKTYLIYYEKFWRFDEGTWTMDKGYPKDMCAWRDVPNPVDAAMVWRGDTYFFRGPRFWRFDNNLVKASQYYPLPTAPIWFPCEAMADMDQYTVNE